MGVLPRKKLNATDVLHSYDLPYPRDPLPESYDVTLKWSMCESVVSIRDQSHCGSCWVWCNLIIRFFHISLVLISFCYNYCF